MGFFGRKKDKEKEKEKKGGLFGWMKRKQADEPEREEQIVEPESETDTDDVAAQMLAEREAARQAETEQWREEAEAEIAADQVEAAALAAKAAQDELLTEEEDSEAENEEDEEEPIVVTFQPEEADSEAEETEPEEVAEPETVESELEEVTELETVETEPEEVAEPETEESELEEPEKKKKKGFFEKIRDGLRKTKDSVIAKMQLVLNAFTKIDEDLFDQLEETMIMGDMGAETSIEICDQLRKRVKERGITDPKQIMGLIQEIIGEMLGEDQTLQLQTKPSVIMVIGVNGAGKTTTIGKLCHQLKEDGKKVIVAAADTFRAAAIDQLEVWTDRAGVELVKHAEGSDPAAVVYDAIEAAKARNCDVLICDTAGRLHNKKNLMQELAKINRIIENKAAGCDKEILLVLDATTGQNAVNQARLFKEVADITGIVLTKLDGTAKGGIIVSIKNELEIPVKLIGVGEKIDDLQPFHARDFVNALFETEERK